LEAGSGRGEDRQQGDGFSDWREGCHLIRDGLSGSSVCRFGHETRHCFGKGRDGRWSAVETQASANCRDVLAVDVLIGSEETDHDLRHSGRKGRHGRAEPAVTDHRGMIT
jgi:hypothetical protein